MEITGTQLIEAPRPQVWDALNDPVILKKCLPGCESLEKHSPEEFKAVMAMAIGPLRARFNGTLHMRDVSAPQRCTMVFEGQGGAIGFGKGSSLVELTETTQGTAISYTANAQVGGKLAQVGSRLIDNVARKMADDFFLAFKQQIAGPPPAAQTMSIPESSNIPPSEASDEEVVQGPKSLLTVSDSRQAVAPIKRVTPPGTAQAASSSVMVPGWWLLVATGIGAALTTTGALLLR
ncbi:carbon monoxide dehydrogenase subunit G [Pusillimonas sp.]|uniref:CoxG family protein n=1 Tax=Pusillimonas sp. TaxID=3040095 RepID=UPI0029B5F1DF|nr:carbon monoxide dehydrogenase subunit G [Pusillimonas sp.]MDX3894628.1 carbon monoxide dehydrogenase subunit G [Pusillimonas sp.]